MSIKNDILKIDIEQIEECLEIIEHNFLVIYNSKVMEMMTMATTKIWSVKDSLSRVVKYASNPEKTIFSNLKQVLLYAENNEKTS